MIGRNLNHQNIEYPIKGEIYSVERLEEYAVFLAIQLETSERPKNQQKLLPRMRDNGKQLLASYRALTKAIHRKENISPAGEWLTENFHIVEDQLREIKEDLPPAFYKELPKIALGELAGYPRIYAIALAIVAHTDSQLESNTIRRFILAFQKVAPLKIGELWALAITLRLVLVENLRRIVLDVVRNHEKRNLANQFADQLFAVAGDKVKFQNKVLNLASYCEHSSNQDCAFTAQMVKRLRDQEVELLPAIEWIEKYLSHHGSSVEQVVHFSNQKQASNQVTVANIITSMRLLSSLNWKKFFESVSYVDRILESDPIYEKMDFLTRDRYRHVIEKIGKKSKISEIKIAESIVGLVEESIDRDPIEFKQAHVGYYLIGKGVKKLELQFKCRINSTFHHFSISHPNIIYFSLLIFFLAIVITPVLIYANSQTTSFYMLVLIFCIVFIPCSDFALNIVNLILTHSIQPKNFPKLDLTHGIPTQGRTMVVIPCMISSVEMIHKLIERIEIHYLGNSDPELFFSLLTDFADAPSEFMNEDGQLLQMVIECIAQLNKKYAHGSENCFYLFHRRRLWNDSEGVWMGWERKRGKIQEFNHLIRGDKNTSFNIVTAEYSFLTTIRYVITLDSDTQLPRDSARKLIGTIMHPLNQPYFDASKGRVTEGYGILQPRIGISLESSRKSLFSKIFSGYTGIDPYTTAVSEVYQDLFGEGSYTGKGLYVVDAFESSLKNRIPQNTILSHDLFEGLYARTGLITDIELLDDYPQSYHTYFTRQHRWTRGDWQIAPWIWGKNQLSLISRWKIFDNLRRSLVAPALFLWFILALMIFPGSPYFWMGYALVIIILPSLVQVIHLAKINLYQNFFYFLFLAHQSYIQLDAIVRIIFRKTVSRKRLLEWTTAAQEELHSKSQKPYWQTCWPIEFFLFGLLLILLKFQPQNWIAGIVLTLSWMSYPLASYYVSRRAVTRIKQLEVDGQLLMRQIARRTWNYFETFVDEDQNWLPPDNHQISPHPLTAGRTSPTNIGLYLLSLTSAHDFGYVTTSQLVKSLKLTLDTLNKLELYEGHFYNWYDTKTLQPLHPKYVSTVDSGNLAGYILAVCQKCNEIHLDRFINHQYLEGIKDTLLIIEDENKKNKINIQKSHVSVALERCRELLNSPINDDFLSWSLKLKNILTIIESLKKEIVLESIISWIDHLIISLNRLLTDIAPFNPSTLNLTLSELSTHESDQSVKMKANQLIKDADDEAYFLEQKFISMNFKFLMDQDREVFSIGYSVTDNKFDSGLYDLLGSESRLASFVSIAKGDVSQEHWFRLGRQLVPTPCGRALVSWSASMFEYLMPLLVLRDYENTLLYETVQSVVLRQVRYGNEHGVPWGVSEAGYNARDFQMNYQYGPFGIPGLGLKRGLSHDLVISPYSTILAAMVNPVAALKNIKRLIDKKILMEYGFFEAIDYTSERLPENQKFAVIRSFMAHHQGMSLVAINNVIHHNIVQDRFHNDPRVMATQLLLQERIPQNVIPVLPKAAEIELESQHQHSVKSLVRQYNDPNTSNPRIQLLSNRNYSLMISTAGGGYSKCGDLAVTRWKEDATRDHWGSYIFIRDLSQNEVWSSTYQPFAKTPSFYKVLFGEDKVEFRRQDGDISTHTQILVAPEDNVEIRHVTLRNHSEKTQILELTSYLEPVLCPLPNDLSHPAFSKLFIQTEFLATKKALLAKRRKRSTHDQENWGLHVVVTDGEMISDVQYETDRARFIGRGRTLADSIALEEGVPLSNTTGATLDPILSLRIKVQIPPHGKIQVAFTTGIAKSREEALELADRYHDIHSFEREAKLAWTKSQVDMRHLNIDSESAHLYQCIAERIIYSDPSLRPPTHQRAANTNMQSSLWPSGISGDLSIVALRINHQKDISSVRKLLRCHEYLRLKGLVYDFVIINEDKTSYYQELQDEIQQHVRRTGAQAWLNKSGGVYILRSDITPAKDIAHIQAVARIFFVADQLLKEQVFRKTIEEKYPESLPISFKTVLGLKEKFETHPPQSLPELEYFNGFGGFSKNGREYVIIIQDKKWTPAPWINVIGNSLGFGFQVSESGSGFTWFINSQTNRLTPWSNDPVCDTPGEIIYLRDDETGEVWNPTPLPIRDEALYVIRHGQGYSVFEHITHGIQHQLTLFVPKNDSVKISHLELKNVSGKKRKISVISYTEWVLGSQREKTAPHLVCDVDQNSGAIFAKNPHDNEFSTKVSFADISIASRTFTCSRKEFLGRNGNYQNPAALKREGLSRKRGTGQDPCAVLQTTLELNSGETHEVSILLGQAESISAARELTLRYRDLHVVKKALEEVIKDWEKITHSIEIKTPDSSMNFLMNGWLLYQTLSCRYWSRTAFYQSGGAYGFRDQLQDCMAFVYSAPQITREHILRSCQHQFVEGDVQHWWHPPSGQGIRTRMSDDLLWLPFVVSYYIKVTGDKSILNEKVPFLVASLLRSDEEDSFTLPRTTSETESVFEHCVRAINHSLDLGQHDLPLMGTGDWNDGMNRVGSQGKGESIWLGWFLYKVLTDFIPFCDRPEHAIYRKKFETHQLKIKEGLKNNAWDGDWYKRAYFDDGTSLGSIQSEECKIDSIAQSWAVISGAGDRNRMVQAMNKVDELLVQKNAQLILLFTPPFDISSQDPGYIKGYVPGVRENGGQYTHAAIWVMMAYAELGNANKAFELFSMLNPIHHSLNELEAIKYKIEPYVIAADIYSGEMHEGRGGWSWYTGAASWYYRAGIESLLGLQIRGDILKIVPCIPSSWKSYEIFYVYGKSKYFITVNNPSGLSQGEVLLNLDGLSSSKLELHLVDDGKNHKVIGNLQTSLLLVSVH